jgi:type II secretory pathway predicted ATPase ExeA
MKQSKKPISIVKPVESNDSEVDSQEEDTETWQPTAVADAFGKNVGVADLFKHKQIEELQALIRTSIEQQVMALVTGPAGSGKTTGVRSVTDELPRHQYLVIYLGQDQTGNNLLSRFTASLGLKPKRYRNHLSLQISQWLTDNLESGGKEVVLVVDETHTLDDGTLEELRLMTNANYDRQSPLSLILVGQPPLRLRLKAPHLDALSQRLRYRFRLEGLNQDETMQYIVLRLTSAGLPSGLFTDEALQVIFQLCEGLPRRINNLCSLALLRAKATNTSKIDALFINEIAELD